MYTVISPINDDTPVTSGLTLTRAWLRMMELAECEGTFARIDGEMRLTITHHWQVPEGYRNEATLAEHYWPDYRSRLVDDRMARADIMRRFLSRGMRGIWIDTDERYRREIAREYAGENADSVVTDAQRLALLWGVENIAGR
jgi:hypothetical protein